MTRSRYLSSPAVTQFVQWASHFVATWTKHHVVIRSRYSPALHFNVTGIEAAYRSYCWRSAWRDPDTGRSHESADAASTEASLARLTAGLQESLACGDSDRHCRLAHAVLEWGGVPVSKTFYSGLHDQGQLIEYHRRLHTDANAQLDPDRADDDRLGSVQEMSAGITKVHCLLSGGRLPIYDSRFAAGMALLISRWCVAASRQSVPADLLLGCGAARGGQQRVPDSPADQTYPRLYLATPATWMQWQVRAAWLLEAILLACPHVFADTPMATRVNRFSMGCFMIGYDLG